MAAGTSNSGAVSDEVLTSWRRDGVSGQSTNGGSVVGGATATVVGVVGGGADGGAVGVVVAAIVAGSLVVEPLDTGAFVLEVSTLLDVVVRDVAVTAAPGAMLPDVQAEASTIANATSPTSRPVGAAHARRVVKRCAPTRRGMVLRSS